MKYLKIHKTQNPDLNTNLETFEVQNRFKLNILNDEMPLVKLNNSYSFTLYNHINIHCNIFYYYHSWLEPLNRF